jgi:ABC-type glycerol-3-phosphate transport system substrate-binding protein
MFKRIISLLAVLVLMVSVFSGCGTSKKTDEATSTVTTVEATQAETTQVEATKPIEAKLTMVYWHPEQKDIMEQMNTKFTEQNKGITIELQQIPGDQYDKVLKTRLLSDNGPDVYLYFGSGVYKYGKDGFYGDLTNEPFAKNVIPAYTGSCTYDGKLYAIPLNAMGSGVLYNKKVFTDAGVTEMPKTYADFLSICEKIKKAGKTPIARGAKDAWTGLHETGPLAANFVLAKNENFQVDRFNEKFKFATNPDMKIYFEKYIELVDKGYIEKGVLGLNHSQAAQEVADGTAAMMMGISVFYADIKAANKDADIGYFSLPDENGNSYQIGASDKAIGYWPEGKNIEAAKMVVGFYATPEINKMYCEASQMLPCIQGVDVNLDEALKQCAEDVSKTKIVFNFFDVPWPVAAADTYRKEIQTIHAGERDVNKMLAEIDKSYDDNKQTVTEPGVK